MSSNKPEGRKRAKTNTELSYNVQRKRTRTVVSAGKPSKQIYTLVHTLKQLCFDVLADNQDQIKSSKVAVSYEILEKVLKKCNIDQLLLLEKINQHIIVNTDPLWKIICGEKYRGRVPDIDEDQSWRELYFRCKQEDDDRLTRVNKVIAIRQSIATQTRSIMLLKSCNPQPELIVKQNLSGCSQTYGHNLC